MRWKKKEICGKKEEQVEEREGRARAHVTQSRTIVCRLTDQLMDRLIID